MKAPPALVLISIRRGLGGDVEVVTVKHAPHGAEVPRRFAGVGQYLFLPACRGDNAFDSRDGLGHGVVIGLGKKDPAVRQQAGATGQQVGGGVAVKTTG